MGRYITRDSYICEGKNAGEEIEKRRKETRQHKILSLYTRRLISPIFCCHVCLCPHNAVHFITLVYDKTLYSRNRWKFFIYTAKGVAISIFFCNLNCRVVIIVFLIERKIRNYSISSTANRSKFTTHIERFANSAVHNRS